MKIFYVNCKVRGKSMILCKERCGNEDLTNIDKLFKEMCLDTRKAIVNIIVAK